MNAPTLKPVLDLSPADWVRAGVAGFAVGIKSLIPDRFEAYGRILHPVDAMTGADQLSLRWVDIAEQTGRQIHPLVQFDSLIDAPRGADRNYEPEIGTLDPDLYAALCDLLEAHTSTPERCWFCLWDGHGNVQGGEAYAVLQLGGLEPADRGPQPPAFTHEVMSGPRVSIPGRDYFLLEGRLQGWQHFFEQGWDSPQIIWPDDRAWCVATEIDLDSTYVGGSKELIARLLKDERFEALPAEADDRIDTGGDTVNGPVVSQD